jgi:P-type E1-E2 ATPase
MEQKMTSNGLRTLAMSYRDMSVHSF